MAGQSGGLAGGLFFENCLMDGEALIEGNGYPGGDGWTLCPRGAGYAGRQRLAGKVPSRWRSG